MDIDELITALESADGPSRELDAEIARAIGYDVKTDGNPAGRFYFQRRPTDWWEDVLPYMESVDAALTLVPDGWDWDVSFEPWLLPHRPDVKTPVRAGYASVSDGDLNSPKTRQHIGRHDTPAIALCIAALRARKTKGE